MTVPHQQSYGQRPAPPPQRFPPPPPAYQAPAPREGRGMQVLRVVTYVLASLASLLFIVLVIYGYVQLQLLSAAVNDYLGGAQSPVPLPTFPSQPGG